VWKGDGGNFLGFEICCWGIGFVWWTYFVVFIQSVVVFVVIIITLPPPCLLACHQIHPPSPSLLEIIVCLLFVVLLCSILVGTKNSAWCRLSFYVWHLYLGCEYKPKIHCHNISSSIDQDSKNNGRRKCIQGGCKNDDNKYWNTHNNMRCQRFNDQHLHTIITHQKEISNNNAIWF